MIFCIRWSMSITTVYKVKLRESALRDLAELRDYLKTVMSREGAHRYVSNMRDEVMSLSVYADLYRPSTMADIRQYHPKARRMVSHWCAPRPKWSEPPLVFYISRRG